MSATPRIGPRSLVLFDVVVEIGTGIGLVVAPALVIRLLLGTAARGDAVAVARVAGFALIALCVACWPSRAQPQPGPASILGLLIYNVLVALYLGYLGAFRHVEALALWPAVALHAAVALLLLSTWRKAPWRSTVTPATRS